MAAWRQKQWKYKNLDPKVPKKEVSGSPFTSHNISIKAYLCYLSNM